jgi:hypothetical protein
MAETAPLHALHDRLPDAGFGLPATLNGSQARRILLALLLLAVVPRALTAWRLPAVCNDAYYYQWVATMWEQGRTATALKYLNVNVYPLILWGLKSTGLPWPLGGMLWGVLVSTLTVLPLFGLARRLFDDRVASVSCFLFAVHPGLIFLSVEPIREPTFWLLFLLSAYWIHCFATSNRGNGNPKSEPRNPKEIQSSNSRFPTCGDPDAGSVRVASTSRSWSWGFGHWLFFRISRRLSLKRGVLRISAGGWLCACGAGIALALAIHTRTEGWALLVLLFTWPITLAPPHVTRLRRILRIATALAMIPAFLLAANLTVLRDHDRWEWGRFAPLRGFVEWLPIDLTGNERSINSIGRGRTPCRPAGVCAAFPSRSAGNPLRSVGSLMSGVPLPIPGPLASQRRAGTESGPDSSPSRRDGPVAKNKRVQRSAAYVFVNQFGEKFEYVSLVFLLVGLVGRGREWLDRGGIPMFILFSGILLAVWVRLTHFGDINGRYFLTAYLVALPAEATGVLIAIERLRTRAAKIARHNWVPTAVPFAILLALTTAFCFKAFTRQNRGRVREAELGRRIREQLPPFRVLEADRSAVRVGHFALGSLPRVAFDDEGDGPPPPEPDVIISAIPVPPPVRERATSCGLVEFSSPELQPEDNGFRVFARPLGARQTGIANRRVNRERR